MASSTIKNTQFKINGYALDGNKTSYDVGIGRTTKTYSLSSAKTVNSDTLTDTVSLSLEAGSWIVHGHVGFPGTTNAGIRWISWNSLTDSQCPTKWKVTVAGNYAITMSFMFITKLTATTTIPIRVKFTGASSLSIGDVKVRAVKI